MTTDSAGQGPVERRVRPVARVQRMGSFQGVPHYGCLLNLEAEHRMKVNDPLYGQAELDAAISASTLALRTALEMAVRQNEHDMLMTGEELRACRAALAGPGPNFNSTADPAA